MDARSRWLCEDSPGSREVTQHVVICCTCYAVPAMWTMVNYILFILLHPTTALVHVCALFARGQAALSLAQSKQAQNDGGSL